MGTDDKGYFDMVCSGIQFLQEERHGQRPKERGCVKTRPKGLMRYTTLEDVGKEIPKSVLKISSGNTIRVVGRWSKSNGEITEGDIVELLSNGEPRVRVSRKLANLNIRLHLKF